MQKIKLGYFEFLDLPCDSKTAKNIAEYLNSEEFDEDREEFCFVVKTESGNWKIVRPDSTSNSDIIYTYDDFMKIMKKFYSDHIEEVEC